jgi:hypothetical protein
MVSNKRMHDTRGRSTGITAVHSAWNSSQILAPHPQLNLTHIDKKILHGQGELHYSARKRKAVRQFGVEMCDWMDGTCPGKISRREFTISLRAGRSEVIVVKTTSLQMQLSRRALGLEDTVRVHREEQGHSYADARPSGFCGIQEQCQQNNPRSSPCHPSW